MDDIKEKGALSEYLSFTDVDNQQVCIKLSEDVYIYSQQTYIGKNFVFLEYLLHSIVTGKQIGRAHV